MSLVPRTFRFDKYQFPQDRTLERVPKPEASRQVLPGKKTGKESRGYSQSPGGEVTEDRFSAGTATPEWSQRYHERRTLWRPKEAPIVSSHISNILILSRGGGDLKGHPFISGLSDKYHCKLEEWEMPPEESRPVAAALKRVSEGSHDLVAFLPKDLDWASALLKEVSEPALVLPTGEKSEFPPERILVPVDGTSFSYPALSQAMVLGEDLQAEIQLLHVSDQENSSLNTVLEKMAWTNVRHDVYQSQGDVAGAIVDFAHQQKAQLIVMGTHGVTPGSTHMPTSVTLEVLNRIPCPLWVVHP
ncbi:MAG: universal stress protein [bacterium]|nr:universal stress protein [bacterium]